MKDGEDPADRPWLADAETCRQLRIRASSAKTRTEARQRHRWQPWSVRDPRTGEPFDTSSAWRFIHELLEAGVEVEVIRLKHPPDKKAYVFFGPGPGGQRIYVKLEFGGNLVVGRSFHISDEMSRNQ